jgi:hypothetical protein
MHPRFHLLLLPEHGRRPGPPSAGADQGEKSLLMEEARQPESQAGNIFLSFSIWLLMHSIPVPCSTVDGDANSEVNLDQLAYPIILVRAFVRRHGMLFQSYILACCRFIDVWLICMERGFFYGLLSQ